jgi:hypothetical protein
MKRPRDLPEPAVTRSDLVGVREGDPEHHRPSAQTLEAARARSRCRAEVQTFSRCARDFHVGAVEFGGGMGTSFVHNSSEWAQLSLLHVSMISFFIAYNFRSNIKFIV